MLSSKQNTFTVSFRCDVRVFATIALWLKQNGVVPTTRNQVLRTGLETLVQSIGDVRPDLRVQSVADAYGLIEELGLLPNAGGRARLQLAKALRSERLSSSLGNLLGDPAPDSTVVEEIKTKGKQAAYADDAQEVARLMAERRAEETKQSEAFKSMAVAKPEITSE